jgi:hypothetical protein
MQNFNTADARGFSMNPRALLGPLSVKSNTFSQYVIRRMTFNYRTETSSTQVGLIAFAIIRDPVLYNDIGGSTNFFSNIKSFEESVSGPFRENQTLTYTYPGMSLWYLDSPNTGIAAAPGFSAASGSYNAMQRLQQQFVLAVSGDSIFLVDTNMGYIDIDYDIEFYGEGPSAFGGYPGLSRENEIKILQFMKDDLVSYFHSNPDLFKSLVEKTWVDKKKPHPLYWAISDSMAIHKGGITKLSPLMKYLVPLAEEEKDYFIA